MKIFRKRDVTGFKVVDHNRKVFWTIIFLLIILIGIIISIKMLNYNSIKDIDRNTTCVSASDCVPASCCHPSSCVLKNIAPDCSGIKCSMECASGTLDCGQASCGCEKGKCVVNFGG